MGLLPGGKKAAREKEQRRLETLRAATLLAAEREQRMAVAELSQWHSRNRPGGGGMCG